MIAVFRLVRGVNLLIIALTMYATRLFYVRLAELEFIPNYSGLHEQIDYFLLVFSTVLIAAGGNIINDYFDVKADRINRPERLIISKYIKQRWAIISHWILNGIAFSIAIYLSIRYHTFWYVFVHLISINALWFYSMYFKKKPFIGNVIIALLTALVPILSGIHFHTIGHLSLSNLNHILSQEMYPSWISFLAADGKLIYGMSFFAFFLNLAREIIKDMQDVTGDKQIHARTLPILFGIKKSARISALILLVIPIVSTMIYFLNVNFIFEDFLFFIPFIVSISIASVLAFLLFGNPSKQLISFSNNMLKIAMLLGLLLPFYWIILL